MNLHSTSLTVQTDQYGLSRSRIAYRGRSVCSRQDEILNRHETQFRTVQQLLEAIATATTHLTAQIQALCLTLGVNMKIS